METIIEKVKSLSKYYDELETAVDEIEDTEKPIKEGKWTPQQHLHHVAEAQTVFYFRIKWILTHNNPDLPGFDGNVWTEETPVDEVNTSLHLIRATYDKTYNLVKDLVEVQWERTGNHLEIGTVTARSLFDHFVNHGLNHLNLLQKQ